MKSSLRTSALFILLALSACQFVTPPSAPATQTTAHQGADAFAPERSTGRTEQKQVYAKHFMAASANPLATEAGYDILKRGGNAIDAMIAIQTTLSLVEPQSSGLGGGAFVVYWDNAARQLTTFDARETAPAAATPELFLDKNGQPLQFMDAVVGGRSVGTPGIPKLMETLHRRYGMLPWKELFAKPIALAEQGFTVSPRLSQSIAQNRRALQRYPQTAAYFLPNGKPLQAGTVLKNPAFAQTVKTLATQGAQPFYHGAYAQNIVQAVQNAHDNPGLLAMRDFQDYQIIERKPVCAPYRQYQICGMDAPSSGGIAVGQILGMANYLPVRPNALKHADTWRILGDASRLAFADRDRYVADPAFVSVPSSRMLSKAYLQQRATLLKGKNALPEVFAGELNDTHAAASAIELPSTSHIVIVDARGNVLSMTTSIENAFGSTLMANGYLLNNELTDFSFEPHKNGKPVANRVQGGKRPRSSMAPTIVMANGRPYMAVGSPGGSRIIGYVAKTLMAHIDGKLPIQQAVSLPNMLNRFGTYELEEHTDATRWQKSLKNMGYQTQIRDLNSGVQAIIISKNGLTGAADPRREGKVMGD